MANKTLPMQENQQDSESDDEEVVETSPCGRWEKHRKEVSQRNVPGIDSSYLAMDTEEGVEVVWNEVLFSEKRSWKNKEHIFKRIFENLTKLDHSNIVKFHKFWVDLKEDQPRLIFITEFMTSGSLRQFLKKTKSSNKKLNLKAWKRWCRQILSALSYLHKCDPPIIHGNLNCDTIFIQHNGLMKIGTVAPESIHRHVKTCKQEAKNMHFIAPEYDGQTLFTALSSPTYGMVGASVNCAADIYSFGMVALELAALILDNDGSNVVSSESIQESIDRIDDAGQKDFIRQCLQKEPSIRPTVKNLLLHPVLLEVYPLKVLSGHCIVDENVIHPDSVEEFDADKVMAEIRHPDSEPVFIKYSQVQPLELEKFIEEIRNVFKTGLREAEVFCLLSVGSSRSIAADYSKITQCIDLNRSMLRGKDNTSTSYREQSKVLRSLARIGLYPLTGMETTGHRNESHPRLNRTRPQVPDSVEMGATPSPEPEEETRSVVSMQCTVKALEETSSGKHMTLVLKFDDRMNRQLTCEIQSGEKSEDLAEELVKYGFINVGDRGKITSLISDNIQW